MKVLSIGQVWKHTTGHTLHIVACGVRTHMFGVTNIAEDLATGDMMAVEDSKEAMVNYTFEGFYEEPKK